MAVEATQSRKRKLTTLGFSKWSTQIHTGRWTGRGQIVGLNFHNSGVKVAEKGREQKKVLEHYAMLLE